MEKNVMEAIEGIQLYPIISLIVFVLFFAGVILWVVKADKEHLKKMAGLPLNESIGLPEEDNFTK